MILDFTTLEVLFTRRFPALRDISPCKRSGLSISKHSATTSLADSSCCQMPLLFLKLCIQGTPLFFFLAGNTFKEEHNVLGCLAKVQLYFCIFAKLPVFSKTIYYLAGSLDPKGFAGIQKRLGFHVFSEEKLICFPIIVLEMQEQKGI